MKWDVGGSGWKFGTGTLSKRGWGSGRRFRTSVGSGVEVGRGSGLRVGTGAGPEVEVRRGLGRRFGTGAGYEVEVRWGVGVEIRGRLGFLGVRMESRKRVRPRDELYGKERDETLQ